MYLGNHLGNVLATISDKKIGVANVSFPDSVDHYLADVVSAQDYYPFGMLMPGRIFNTSKGRYLFNGKESDNDVNGDGNQYDYGFRIYNPRIGRFLSVDPLQKNYPWFTPYQYAGNSPIANIDLDGLENLRYNVIDAKKSNGETAFAIQFAREEDVGIVETFVRLNTAGHADRHDLYYNGRLIAQFSSLQEMTVVTHGKTIAQIEKYQSEDLRASEMARVFMAISLGQALSEHPAPVNYGRNPVQNQQLLDDAQNEMLPPLSTSRPLSPNSITSKAASASGSPAAPSEPSKPQGRYVYRGLSAADKETVAAGQGITATNPNANNNAVSHIANKKPSRWISTTKSEEIAKQKYGANGYIKIDLNKVPSDKVDLSNGIPSHTKGSTFNNYVKKDKEVLIEKHIPQEAIIKTP